MAINLNQLQMQYIGACSLLGRLSNRRGLSDDDRDAICRALDDCAQTFKGRFEVVEVGEGGVSLEPQSPE
jgi:hypothetical protein